MFRKKLYNKQILKYLKRFVEKTLLPLSPRAHTHFHTLISFDQVFKLLDGKKKL